MPDRDANTGPGSPPTPEERAARLVDDAALAVADQNYNGPDEGAIAAAIRAAVAEEREACAARVAEFVNGDVVDGPAEYLDLLERHTRRTLQKAAAALRARGRP